MCVLLALDPLGLELLMVVSHIWMLGTKPRLGSKFSGRAASSLNCRIISPGFEIQFLLLPSLYFILEQRFWIYKK